MRAAEILTKDGIGRTVQMQFPGVTNVEGAADGAIIDEYNMTSSHAPVLAVRQKRITIKSITDPNGIICCDDDIYYATGTSLKRIDASGNETLITEALSNEPHEMVIMGDYLLIFPDAVYVKLSTVTEEEAEVGKLRNSWSNATGVSFRNGTIYGVKARANVMHTDKTGGFGDGFRAGDAVKIVGCTVHEQNNKTAIIREISEDKKDLIFSEDCFRLNDRYTFTADSEGTVYYYFEDIAGVGRRFSISGYVVAGSQLIWDGSVLWLTEAGSTVQISYTEADKQTGDKVIGFTVSVDPYSETGVIRVVRDVPVMSHVCVNENRLFGCHGDAIYVSKLGDPFNFNVFDGLETDSYTVDTGTAGEFTACCSYLGYPMFFKETHIFKMYGNRPSNYELIGNARNGVKYGCSGSLAVAGEVLYYLSPRGIMAYTGSVPTCISDALGMKTFGDAVGGSDGRKYYVTMGVNGVYRLYVWDTDRRMWNIEDSVKSFGFDMTAGGKFIMMTGNKLVYAGDTSWAYDETMESDFRWNVVFADIVAGEPNKKQLEKCVVRTEMVEGAFMQFYISFDDAAYITLGDLITATGTDVHKRTFVLPVVPHRCDHFHIKIEGQGDVKIYSLSYQFSVGSELMKH